MSTNILAISGSLRNASLNSALLRAAEELSPAGTAFRYASIGDIPHYSSDLDGDHRPLAGRAHPRLR